MVGLPVMTIAMVSGCAVSAARSSSIPGTSDM